MKFSGDRLLLILLALALVLAMLLTLWLGGNRSQHGYGSLLDDLKTAVLRTNLNSSESQLVFFMTPGHWDLQNTA